MTKNYREWLLEKQVTVAELKEYFNQHYSHFSLELELTDKEIYQQLKRWNFMGFTLGACADCLADYILANGLGEI